MITTSLSWQRITLYAAALLASFIAGAVYQGEKQPEVQIKTETKVEYRDREVVKYVDRVVTKVKTQTIEKPDGTRVTTREDTNSNENISTGKRETEVKESNKQNIVLNPSKPPYSLGVELYPQGSLLSAKEFLKSFSDKPGLRISGGLRLGNTDFSLFGTGDSGGHIGIGLRFDF